MYIYMMWKKHATGIDVTWFILEWILVLGCFL